MALEKQLTWQEVQKLAEENSKLVGNTNAREKIKYHHRVKEENVLLKQDKVS